jgi:hypothetical protein
LSGETDHRIANLRKWPFEIGRGAYDKSVAARSGDLTRQRERVTSRQVPNPPASGPAQQR